MNKKIFLVLFAFLFIISILAFAKAETSYCCEKTINGAWCQNAPEEQCADSPFRKAATSCESTSYCKLGTCVDTGEGVCQENTPQKVCENNEGVWYDKPAEELSQCQLGCCLLGDQAAFVTQTRCKTLSSLSGLETIFRNDLTNEFECIASASSDEKGACVIEKNGERICKMLTQKECQTIENSISSESSEEKGNLFSDLFKSKNNQETTETRDISFHEGYLCSADILGTNCGPKGGTTCVEGEDQVYFLDTCGNLANIYDYSKRNDPDYWTYIKKPEESCGYGKSNANSRTCGNCDYYLGSTCKSYRQTNSPAALYGDYVCADLSCEYEGKKYEHGEVWCGSNTKEGVNLNVPGSESFRLMCYNGEVNVEPCDPWRATICVESEIDGFSYAVCRANLWLDCVEQKTKQDCENSEKRDCNWIQGYSILRDAQGYELVMNDKGELVEAHKDKKTKMPDDNRPRASCVPKYAPGFNFWESDSESVEICDIGTYSCVVKYKYGIFTGKESIEEKDWKKRAYCEENCYCVPGWVNGAEHNAKIKDSPFDSNEEFLKSLQGICGAMGDCGVSVNYVGSEGYYEEYKIDFSDVQ